MAPVLGRKRVERRQRLAVAIELGHRFGVLGGELATDGLSGGARVALGRRFHHLVQQRLRPGLQPLGQRVEDVGDLVHPALLTAGTREHVTQRGPGAQRAVAGYQPRFVEAALLEVAQDDGPRLGALAVAVLDGQQFLDAVLAHPDYDQQAQPVVFTEPGAIVKSCG